MMANMNSTQNNQATQNTRSPQNVYHGNTYQPLVAQIQYIQPAQPNLQVQPNEQVQQIHQPQDNDGSYRPVSYINNSDSESNSLLEKKD
jgi:hypothetical protein